MKTTFFLTEVAKDWGNHNLSIAQETLVEAEKATAQRVDKIKDPLFDTPNYPNIRGYMRWVMVQKHFHLAAKKFHGITPAWVNLGGVNMLELHGKYTIVTPCHLLKQEATPNETQYRRDLRIQNQVCPLLFNLDNGPKVDLEENRLRILLVHGAKEGIFAYLRAYIDPENSAIYRDLSENIMLMPKLLPSIDFEPVEEPKVGLKDTGEKKKSASGEE
ncbi:MAG TPA: hypothetical protein VGY56_01830 [Verrucomicrobiae bacterium]|nr:hypothetical protein [Verrucomicrobiae bacterium]